MRVLKLIEVLKKEADKLGDVDVDISVDDDIRWIKDVNVVTVLSNEGTKDELEIRAFKYPGLR